MEIYWSLAWCVCRYIEWENINEKSKENIHLVAFVTQHTTLRCCLFFFWKVFFCFGLRYSSFTLATSTIFLELVYWFLSNFFPKWKASKRSWRKNRFFRVQSIVNNTATILALKFLHNLFKELPFPLYRIYQDP